MGWLEAPYEPRKSCKSVRAPQIETFGQLGWSFHGNHLSNSVCHQPKKLDNLFFLKTSFFLQLIHLDSILLPLHTVIGWENVIGPLSLFVLICSAKQLYKSSSMVHLSSCMQLLNNARRIVPHLKKPSINCI